MWVRRALLAVAVACAGCSCAIKPDTDELVRTRALALLQTLNADLLSHPSATLTLERWCARHRLAEPPRVIVRRLRGAAKPLPAALRAKLQVAAGARIGYRHVQLVCGDRVLSEADNWYVPARLGDAMNRQLDSTDVPFGKVVRGLDFQRRTLSVRLLWSPLPTGWETGSVPAAQQSLRIPGRILRHEAILYSAEQVPFSAVVETYRNGLFDFGAWAKYLEHD